MATMTMSMMAAMCDLDAISLRPMGGRMQSAMAVQQQQPPSPANSTTATTKTHVAATGATAAADDHRDTDAHPLHRRWAWWVHRPCYEGSSYAGTWEPMAKAHVSTIESFWRHQNNLPSPNALFGANRERVRDGAASAIEGISFFEAGVLPEWEHVRNAMGASVVFKGAFGPRHASAVWERVLLALVGEQTGDDSERITGARMVDRISSMRVEVWLDDDDPQLADRVGRWFLAHAFDGVVAPGAVRDFFVSPHVQAKSTKGEGYRAAPHVRRPSASATRRAPAPEGASRSGRGGDRAHARPPHGTRTAPDRVF
ncbi:Eukaryotic translation initiation factor 4e [Pandoravirus kuranda]|uniref:Eukaryotic translation initiation factor 4e n=2 Tax=Pandoravirus TaxID=2060084 RepID=A0AA95EEF2_9VIRU|nr:Eukaryotic translation initiation factor 4E [Pandoravirus neocaledonia]AVK75868.1 Eukaryotic translation initiation factor 4E [Pandoravirus neocaledonia]WBR14410.1 Eukaryotic translation initiation factor 4e [Pandoravirus kuranda]